MMLRAAAAVAIVAIILGVEHGSRAAVACGIISLVIAAVTRLRGGA
jgi:hypothetical protein